MAKMLIEDVVAACKAICSLEVDDGIELNLAFVDGRCIPKIP